MLQSNQKIIFTFTIFLSAFILFLIQPMVGKILLPLLGGTPSVWNTAMVFFQVLLLAGYFYAHILGKIKSVRNQLTVHGVVLAISFFALPMQLSFDTPPDDASPLIWQIVTMAGMIGIPFFVLSSSAPLLQKWFSLSEHPNAHAPYFLYSASNLGSVLSLMLYPILIERILPLPDQNIFFYAGFGLLICCVMLSGLSIKNAQIKTAEDVSDTSARPPLMTLLTWLFLAFVPSSLMLGFTSFVTTDIGSTPLFWAIPLTLYILSFVIAFADKKRISLSALKITFISLFIVVNVFLNMILADYKWEVAIVHGILFFVTALMCHQQLEALKPSPRHLTLFFLIMSIGGACGGIFNALIAPLIFLKPYEYMLTSALALVCWGIGQRYKYFILVGMLLMALHPVVPWEPVGKKLIYISRNYFGTLTVRENNIVRTLAHGTTDHGSQAIDEKLKLTPITYYYYKTGVAQTVKVVTDAHPKVEAAVLGLGAGVMNCHFRKNDHLTFIEIDPDIIKIAKDKDLYTYLSGCGTPATIIQGDARLKLKDQPAQSFDYILVDVFSGDNIPMHLMTKEAVAIYLEKLKPDGMLTLHVSNRYMHLAREVGLIAKSLNINAFHKVSAGGKIPQSDIPYFMTEVVTLTNNEAYEKTLLAEGWEKMDLTSDTWHPWTDTYANPLRALFN